MSIIDGLQSQYQPFKSYVPKDIDDIKKRVVNEVEEYFANLLNDYENVSTVVHVVFYRLFRLIGIIVEEWSNRHNEEKVY